MSQIEEKQEKRIKYFQDLDELPIPDQFRVCTDTICIIFGLVVTLIVLILAFVLYDQDTYVKSNFPTDTDGKLCGYQISNFPYVYFVSLPDIRKRVCVSSCPSQQDIKLNCYMTKQIGCRFSNTPGFQVQFYDNEPQQNRLGKFCLPKNKQLKQNLLIKTQLKNKLIFLNSLDTLIQCAKIALFVSVAYLALVQGLSNLVNICSSYLGVFTDIGLILTVVLYPTQNQISKIIILVLLSIILITMIINICVHQNQIRVYGVFLNQVSTIYNTDYYFIFFYIPIFLFLELLLLYFSFLTIKVFWTAGNLYFNPQQSLFWQFQGLVSIILSIFLFLYVVCVFSFLKESFSSVAVSWYYHSQWTTLDHLKFFFTKHIGSVIAASLITGLFTIWDYIFDILRPQRSFSPGKQGIIDKFCGIFSNTFDLVRSDAMGYILLTGNPYCNSARFCQYICSQSILLHDSKSSSRIYRICSHFLIGSIVGLYAFIISKVQISLYSLIAIMSISWLISTFFISIHADGAQSIQIMFILNEEIQKRKNQIKVEEFDRDQQGVLYDLDFKKKRLLKQICRIFQYS